MTSDTMKPTTRKSSRRSSRRGALTVEFALCSAVFFLVVMAGFEFTRYTFARHSVDQAAYEAARVAIVPGKTANQIQTQAQQFLSAAGIRNATITITPSVFTTTTETVTVDIQCSFTDNSWIPPTFLRTATIRSTITLDHENKAYLSSQQVVNEMGDNNSEPHDT